MKLYDIMSYKTFYYFLKDNSYLLMDGYNLHKSEIEFDKLTQQEFYDTFRDDLLGTDDDIVEIRTNKGSLVYHRIDNENYMKDFITRNSQKAPCAVFGNYRTSDVYLFGFAKKGKLERFFSCKDGMATLEGEITSIEKKLGLDLKVGASGVLKTDIDEEDIINCAKNFVGFDIENEDVKILGVYYYLRSMPEREKRVLPDIKLEDNIMAKIHKNMFIQNIERIPLLLIKKETSDRLYLISYNENKNEEDFVLFNEIIPDYKDADMFNKAISNCLDTLSKCNFFEGIEVDGTYNRTLSSFKIGKNANALILLINNKYINTLSFTQSKKKGKQLNRLQMILRFRHIKNFQPKDMDKLYKMCIRRLK